MRHLLWITAVLAFAGEIAAQDKPTSRELRTGLIANGLALKAGEHKVVYFIHFEGAIPATGEGKCKLQIDPNRPTIDEFGYLTMTTGIPTLNMDCTIKLVKKAVIKIPESGRVAAPLVDVRWAVYELQGKLLHDKVTIALREGETWLGGVLLVHDEKGVVRQTTQINEPGPPEPCHPGCFPAGTKINVPEGTRLIETIRVGDSITTVSKDGVVGQGKVDSIFVTKNRLIEVTTEAGTLVTTLTQPLSLASGMLKPAGELEVGDQILIWTSGRALPSKVKEIQATSRFDTVYNLVLGEPKLFVANGYLARSKPPAEARTVSP